MNKLINKYSQDFFKNYDLKDSFYNNIGDYDSVLDFLKKSRKKRRKNILRSIKLKKAMDFMLDNQVTPILNEDGVTTMTIGFNDIQNQPGNERLVSELNYYQKEDYDPNLKQNKEKNLNFLNLLKNKEQSLLGLNQNFNDLDSSELTPEPYNNQLSDNNDGTKVIY